MDGKAWSHSPGRGNIKVLEPKERNTKKGPRERFLGYRHLLQPTEQVGDLSQETAHRVKCCLPSPSTTQLQESSPTDTPAKTGMC